MGTSVSFNFLCIWSKPWLSCCRRIAYWFQGDSWGTLRWKHGSCCLGDIEEIQNWGSSKFILQGFYIDYTLISYVQIFAFMLDNASNNDTMVDGIADRARKEGIILNAKWMCLRCLPHTIHLAAVKVSWEYMCPLQNIILTSFLSASRSDWCNLKGWCTEIIIEKWKLSGFRNNTSESNPRWRCSGTECDHQWGTDFSTWSKWKHFRGGG